MNMVGSVDGAFLPANQNYTCGSAAYWPAVSIASAEPHACLSSVEAILYGAEPRDGFSSLPPDTRAWLGDLGPQLPNQFWIHDDGRARRLARSLGVSAFAVGNRIVLGDIPRGLWELVLRHELVHLAQVGLGASGRSHAAADLLEDEANGIARLPSAIPATLPADPGKLHPILWFIPVAIGLYVLFRPSPANAPGPGDVTAPALGTGQIVAEALCIFALPGGAFSLGGRVGFGFLGSSALAGAVTGAGSRAIADYGQGELSSPLMYVFSTTTGAVIGFVVPGGISLVGQGIRKLDHLAAYGLSSEHFRLLRVLSSHVESNEVSTAEDAMRVLQAQSLLGVVSKWWLNARARIVLYRGQVLATEHILSPLARDQDLPASEAFVNEMLQAGLTRQELANFAARYNNEPVPPFNLPPGLSSDRAGAVGIPTTAIPGIAADAKYSGIGGTVYVILVPRSTAILANGWPVYKAEAEHIILNQVPPGSLVRVLQSHEIAPLWVDAQGRLVPGRLSPPR